MMELEALQFGQQPRRSSSFRFLNDAEDDDDNEVVVFGEGDGEEEELAFDIHQDHSYYDDDEYGHTYSYDSSDGHSNSEDSASASIHPGYTRNELMQEVTFINSSKDPETGDFCQEQQTLAWCLRRTCEQVEPGLWAGAWYFTNLYGEQQGKRAWSESKNTRLVKESFGKARKMDNDTVGAVLREKSKGNRAFSRGQYKSALDSYLQAESLMGGDIAGMYLVPNQRSELMKILSNQAECYLRMHKYEKALLQSSAALNLDKTHQKSILRRAKALFYGCEEEQSLDDAVAALIADDLQALLDNNQGNTDNGEALALMKEIQDKLSTL